MIPRSARRFGGFSLLAIIAAAAALTVSPAEITACLGVDKAYADWAAIAREKAMMSEEAWHSACRQTRDANARRVSAIRTLLATGASPVGGFPAATAQLANARKAADPTVAELFRVVAVEQAAREGLRSGPVNAGISPLAMRLYRAVVAVDATNADIRSRAWLKPVIARRGWFTISRDGAEADKAAQLIVQHADADVTFKGEMIALMEPLVEAGESDRGFFPYMYDRWAAQAGKPLRFGFQGACKSKGVWEPLPIEDPEHLDERRRRYGVTRSFAEEKSLNSARCP